MAEESPRAEDNEKNEGVYRQIDPQTGMVMTASSREEAEENARQARENRN